MDLRTLFEKEGAFFSGVMHPARWYHDKVQSDITVHTTRPNVDHGETNDIIDAVRPNEPEDIKDYRKTADKQVTGGGVKEFLSKCNRIIRQSNISMSSLSESSAEWNDQRLFVDNHQNLDLDTYTIDVVLRRSLAHSPNEVWVAFPYNGNDVELPPINLELNESPSIKPLLIPHSDLRYGMGHLIFTTGVVEIPKGEQTSEEEVLFGADDYWWYKFEPFYEKNDKGNYILKYKMIEWFYHNTGESLINFIAGERALSQDGLITYQETHIKSYYDFCWSAMSAFSDDFIVRHRFSHPITEMTPPDCHGCGGSTWEGGVQSKGKCTVCKGEGRIVWPGPGEVYVNDSDSTLKDGESKKKLVEFHNPDIAYAKNSFDVSFKFLTEAKQSIGLDLLNGTSSESGVAKDLRLEALQDKLSKIASNLFECRDRFSWQVECLLVPDEGSRLRPVTMIPQKLSVKDLTTLKEEAEDALPENRVFAHREYYAVKYQNDPLLIHMHSLLLDYSPLFVLNRDEINVLLAKDVCTVNDMVKKIYATQAIEYVMKSIDILEADELDVFAAMDDYLESRGLLTLVEEAQIEDENIPTGEPQLITNAEVDSEGDEDVGLGGDDDLGEVAPSTDRSNKEKAKDVIDLYYAKKISREAAIDQLVELSGKSKDVISNLLK